MAQTNAQAQNHANLIWKIADLLRGPYQPNQYGDVILPFTILRRLDCILEPTKDQVLAEYKKISATKVDPDVLLKAKFKLPFYNTSRWSFASLISDPEMVALDEVIAQINDLFSGDHPDSSVRNVVTHIRDRLKESETLQQQVQSNTLAQFSASPDLQNEFVGAVIGAMASSEDLSAQILNNPELSQKLLGELVPLIYKGLKTTA